MSKKDIIITLHISELLYDIKDRTHHASLGEADAAKADRMHVTDDQERLSLVQRYLGNALGDVRAAVSEYAPDGPAVADNLLDGRDKMSLTLHMPENYNDGVTEGLAAAIHRYITDRAIGEWFSAVAPDQAPPYLTLAAASLAEVKHLVHQRQRPPRRPCTVPVGYLWDDNEPWDDSALWKEHA